MPVSQHVKFPKKEPLYRIPIDLKQDLLIISIKDDIVSSAYEEIDGSRYLYQRTYLHHDEDGYYIIRHKERHNIPKHLIK